MAVNQTPPADILTALRNLRRDRSAGITAPIAAAQSQIAGPPAGSLGDLQRSAAAIRGEDTSAVGLTGAKQSNVQETVERAAAKEQLDKMASDAAAAEKQEQLKEQQVQTGFEQGQREADLTLLATAERASSERARILESARQAKAEGRLARAQAAVAQADFLGRLENDKYLTELSRTGEMKRLGDRQEFKKALAEDVFGEQLVTLKERLSWDEMMNLEENKFQEKLSNISLSAALDLANSKLKSQNMEAGMKGATGLVSGAAHEYETAKSSGAFDEGYNTWADSEEQRLGFRPTYDYYKQEKLANSKPAVIYANPNSK